MKKLFSVLLMGLLACQLGQAKDMEKLFSSFSKEKDVAVLDANDVALVSVSSRLKGLGEISSVKMLSIDDCSSEVKERFLKEVKKLNKKGYETLVKNSEDDEVNLILVKIKENKIVNLIIVAIDDDLSMVGLKGSLDPSQVGKLTNGAISK